MKRIIVALMAFVVVFGEGFAATSPAPGYKNVTIPVRRFFNCSGMNGIFGDPAYGIVKTLKVRFSNSFGIDITERGQITLYNTSQAKIFYRNGEGKVFFLDYPDGKTFNCSEINTPYKDLAIELGDLHIIINITDKRDIAFDGDPNITQQAITSAIYGDPACFPQNENSQDVNAAIKINFKQSPTTVGRKLK